MDDSEGRCLNDAHRRGRMTHEKLKITSIHKASWKFILPFYRNQDVEKLLIGALFI